MPALLSAMNEYRPYLIFAAVAIVALVLWYRFAPPPAPDRPGIGDAYSLGPGL